MEWLIFVIKKTKARLDERAMKRKAGTYAPVRERFPMEGQTLGIE